MIEHFPNNAGRKPAELIDKRCTPGLVEYMGCVERNG